MDESVRLAVITGDEAEALCRVEELDRSRRFFTGQLSLGPALALVATAAAILDRKRVAFDLEVGRRNPAATIDQSEFERLTVGQAGEARLLDRRDVDEDVLTAIVPDDEAETLVRVEELHDAFGFTDDLGGHAAAAAWAAEAATTAAAEAATAWSAVTAAAAATAAIATATAAAAEAVATAAAAAEPVAAAEAASFKSAAEILTAADIVALVSAATAALTTAPSVKTHLVSYFPAPKTLFETTALG